MNEKKLRKKDIEKYSNAILFLCQKLGGKIYGKKKLYKLLYYADFDMYEYKESMKTITGNTYKAWKMGPVPETEESIIDKMVESGKIRRESIHTSDAINDTIVYTALVEPDIDVFSEDEKYILHRVVDKYGKLTGRELEILTHAEAPYIATENNETIDYSLAFYRETDFDGKLANA